MVAKSRSRNLCCAAKFACAFVVVTVCGCNVGMPRSGFLDDYTHFQKLDYDAEVWGYADPAGFGRTHLKAQIWVDNRNLNRAGQYDKIMVDPTVVRLNEDAMGKWEDPQRVEEMATHVRDALIEAMEDRYPVVDEPGAGVLRFRGAITDAYPAYKYATPDRDKHPVKSYLNSSPGGGSFEGEAVDSVTGERIVAVIGRVQGTTYDTLRDEDTWEQAKRGIAGLTRFIRMRMDQEHERAVVTSEDG
jgi:hypothetical protein